MFFCIGVVANFSQSSYTVNENAGTADIDILLDRPNCEPVTITVLPAEKSPVNASSSKQYCYCTPIVLILFFLVASDFDDTPITVTIMPGDTSGTASIPITNDMTVEGSECFDVTLTPDSNGVIPGTPNKTEVTIIDDGDSECLRVNHVDGMTCKCCIV